MSTAPIPVTIRPRPSSATHGRPRADPQGMARDSRAAERARPPARTVRAIFGFLNIFLKTLNDRGPTHVAIAFDVSAPTFRHETYTDYKAHRPPYSPGAAPAVRAREGVDESLWRAGL